MLHEIVWAAKGHPAGNEAFRGLFFWLTLRCPTLTEEIGKASFCWLRKVAHRLCPEFAVWIEEDWRRCFSLVRFFGRIYDICDCVNPWGIRLRGIWLGPGQFSKLQEHSCKPFHFRRL